MSIPKKKKKKSLSSKDKDMLKKKLFLKKGIDKGVQEKKKPTKKKLDEKPKVKKEIKKPLHKKKHSEPEKEPKKKTPIKKAVPNKAAKKKAPKKKPFKKPIPKKPSKKKGSHRKKKKKQKEKRPLSLYQIIRSTCWRERKTWYDGYHDRKFLDIVRAVYQECQVSDQPCDEKHLLELFDTYAPEFDDKGRKDKPELPAAYYPTDPPLEFYTIYDINWTIFAKICPELLIIAPDLIISPSEINILKAYKRIQEKDKSQRKQEIDNINHHYFQDWVDWCNLVHRTYFPNESPVRIYWALSDAKWDNNRRLWYAEIYPCNESGVYWNWGYDPNRANDEEDFIAFGEKPEGAEHKFKYPSEEQPIPTPPTPPEEKPIPTPEPEKQKEEPTPTPQPPKEDESLNKIKRLVSVKNSYLDEQDRILDQIKKWKDIGDEEEVKELKVRYKAIEKKIDAINIEIDNLK